MSSVWIGARNVTKGEQKELKLEIGLPSEGFPKTLYFNRFRVEREGEVCLLQFGLVSESTLLGSYTCAFPQEALHQNQKSLLDYLNKTGRPTTSPTEWKGAPVEKQVEVADVIAMAFRGGLAETCFYVFLVMRGHASQKSRQRDYKLSAVGAAAEFGRVAEQLIVALYEE